MRSILINLLVVFITLVLFHEAYGFWRSNKEKSKKPSKKPSFLEKMQNKIKKAKKHMAKKIDKFTDRWKNKKLKQRISGSPKYVPKFSPLLFAEQQGEQLAERLGGSRKFTEGDIRISPIITQVKGGKLSRREVLTSNEYKWSTKTIPYVLDSSLGSTARDAINVAFQDFSDFTCLQFIQRSSEVDYLNIMKETGCWSYVGRIGGKQDVSIGTGCVYKGTIVHELMHALGFFHEHTRPDRDAYIKIYRDNIQTDKKSNFDKYDTSLASDYEFPYDFDSVMHYDTRAFSKNLIVKTIAPVNDSIDEARLGQRSGFSDTDRAQIRKVYCEQSATTSTTTTTTTATTTTSTTTTPTTTTPTTTTSTTTTPTTTTSTTTPTTTTSTTTTSTTTTPTTTTPTTTTSTTTTPITTTDSTSTTSTATTSTTTVKSTSTKANTKPTATAITAPGEVTKAITLIPGETPTRKPTVHVTKTTTPSTYEYCVTSTVNPYPCWPQDFVWSSTGLPSNCNCHPQDNNGTCRCNCVKVEGTSKDASWANNYLCYKDTEKNPNLQWSTKGTIPDKNCVKITEPNEEDGWNNNYLCVDRDSPYHFAWSDTGTLKDKGVRCMSMNEPEDKHGWDDNYLCASGVTQDRS